MTEPNPSRRSLKSNKLGKREQLSVCAAEIIGFEHGLDRTFLAEMSGSSCPEPWRLINLARKEQERSVWRLINLSGSSCPDPVIADLPRKEKSHHRRRRRKRKLRKLQIWQI